MTLTKNAPIQGLGAHQYGIILETAKKYLEADHDHTKQETWMTPKHLEVCIEFLNKTTRSSHEITTECVAFLRFISGEDPSDRNYPITNEIMKYAESLNYEVEFTVGQAAFLVEALTEFKYG